MDGPLLYTYSRLSTAPGGRKNTFHTIDCNLFRRRKFVHINDQGSYLCTILFCGLDFHYINFMQDFAFVKNQWVLLTKEL